MKKTFSLLFVFMFIPFAAYADLSCPKDADGKIVVNAQVKGNDGCDFEAEAIKFSLYQIALCTQEPSFSTSAPPDYTGCTFILNSSSGQLVEMKREDQSVDVQSVQQPALGTYKFAIVTIGTDIDVKATVSISGGTTTWTDGSGLSTGSKQYNTLTHHYGRGLADDEVPGFGHLTYHGTDSSYKWPALQNSATRSNFVYTLNTPIEITEITEFSLGINFVSSAALLVNSSSGAVTGIEDGPIGLKFIVNNPKPF